MGTEHPNSDHQLALWVASPAPGGSAPVLDAALQACFRSLREQGARLVNYINPHGSADAKPERLPGAPRYLCLWLSPPADYQTSLASAAEAAGLGGWGESLVTHCLATYQPTGGLPPIPLIKPPSEPPYAGLMVGLTDCPDPKDLSDFEIWYDQVHVAEALAPGIFETARRFRRSAETAAPLADASVDQPTPQFLALYESREPGAQALAQLMQPEHRPTTPMHPASRLRAVWAFDRLGG